MATAHTVASRERGKLFLINQLKAHPIFAMIILMYVLAWPKLIASATDSYGLTHLNLSPALDILTGWAPAIAAFTITALVQGKQGVQTLRSKIFRWRVGMRWYAMALLGAGALIFAEGGLYAVLTGNLMALPIAQLPPLETAGSMLVMFLLYMVFNTEEIAWRGFVLPRLQSRYGALRASVILWVPWTLLHLPYFLTKDSMLQQMGIIAFASGTLMMSIVFTWVFNNAKGSVLICTIMHAALNTWPPLLIPTHSGMPNFLGYALDGAIVLCLIVIFGVARLSHKQDNEPFTYKARLFWSGENIRRPHA